MASGEFCGWLDVASGKRVVCEEAAALGKVTILTKRTFCILEFLFFLFYVLRLFLRVGTPRAQYSECVPSHSFTLVFYTEVTK